MELARSTPHRSDYLYLQSSRWSFTIPIDCMKEYVITGPTNDIPSFFRSLLILLDTSVSVGMSAPVAQHPSICSPSVYDQKNESRLPCRAIILFATMAFPRTL